MVAVPGDGNLRNLIDPLEGSFRQRFTTRVTSSLASGEGNVYEDCALCQVMRRPSNYDLRVGSPLGRPRLRLIAGWLRGMHDRSTTLGEAFHSPSTRSQVLEGLLAKPSKRCKERVRKAASKSQKDSCRPAKRDSGDLGADNPGLAPLLRRGPALGSAHSVPLLRTQDFRCAKFLFTFIVSPMSPRFCSSVLLPRGARRAACVEPST